jgi:hypothetical protein
MHAWRAPDFGESPLRALSALTDLLTHDIAILDDAAVGLELHLGSRDVTRSLPHRPFDDASPPPGVPGSRATRDLDALPVDGVPGVRDPRGGQPRGVSVRGMCDRTGACHRAAHGAR